jgi:hypothetical protein
MSGNENEDIDWKLVWLGLSNEESDEEEGQEEKKKVTLLDLLEKYKKILAFSYFYDPEIRYS